MHTTRLTVAGTRLALSTALIGCLAADLSFQCIQCTDTLVARRLLKAALTGQPSQYANDELTTLARHCTDQEDNAAKVERQVRKSAAALLLASRIGARFDAIVTGASEKGTWVRISAPTAEGRVVRGFEGLDPSRLRPVPRPRSGRLVQCFLSGLDRLL